jgi:competence protein ComEA
MEAMDGGLRDWLSGLSRREIALLALVGLVAAGGAGLWYVRALPRPVEVRADSPVAAPVASPSPAQLVVHVAGWVRRPGVYELPDGDRVVDAIEAAGGPRKGADLGALNLAALLVDAQQVLVPRAAEGASAPVGASPGDAGTGSVPLLVNVNVAEAEELETLPGIGEVLAAAIIAYREEHGPFTSVDQLLDVSGIGEVTLEEIRDLVTV